MSPSDRQVYVISEGTNSLFSAARKSNGQLLFSGDCLANDPTQGCLPVPLAALASASGLAVSPDGKNIYVTANGASAVTTFTQPSSGLPSFSGTVRLASLRAANAVAVSPDGGSVYAVAGPIKEAPGVPSAVNHFVRDTQTGQLTFANCLASDADAGCTLIPGRPIDAAAGVAVSPDGASVYVASFAAGSLSHFARAST